MTPQIMQYLILGCLAAMALLALFYLRGRRLSLAGYLAWGLVILLIPAVGPFLAILLHPGKQRYSGVESRE